ncbi:hypothetical protein YC2023_086563 [Brassica napus]
MKAHVFVKLRCVSPDITGFIRVRPELAVDDRKDSDTFVVFNKELTKLIKQDATTLALEEVHHNLSECLSNLKPTTGCLEDLAGKDYVFQIRITPCRFIPNQCTFTVSAISDDIFFVAAATKLKSLTGKVDKQQQQPATRLMRRRELWELTKHILPTLKTKKKLQTLMSMHIENVLTLLHECMFT